MNYAKIAFVSIILGCSVNQPVGTNAQNSSLSLSFEDCGEGVSYRAMEFRMTSDFKREKLADDQAFCEYRFDMSNETIFYLTSNIYDGSSLNYENRLAAGVTSYSLNRRVGDTIHVSGTQADGKFWKEHINGTYTIGYVNATDTSFFDDIIDSILLKD